MFHYNTVHNDNPENIIASFVSGRNMLGTLPSTLD